MNALDKTTRANRLREAGHFNAAIRLHIEALRELPSVDFIWLNLGACLEAHGWLRWAERAYRQALALQPERHEAALNLALLLLKTGRYAEGFRHYQRRWDCTAWPQKFLETGLRRWRGESLPGQTILVLPDQGFGDCMQAARFCHWLKAHSSARIVLLARAPLRRLFADSGLADEVVSADAIPADCKWVVSQWDIPSLLPWSAQAFQPVSYFDVPDERRLAWQERLQALKRPRVGLVWRGNPQMAEDKWRSIPIPELQPLLALQEADFISLQKDASTGELQQLAAYGMHFHAGALFEDFADTAACIKNLDLLITTDTAVAHVAGGMGIPVWLLLYRLGDWRWGHDGDRSDWYPSIRIFRQRRLGEWCTVMDEVAAALRGHVAALPATAPEVSAAALSNQGVALFQAGQPERALASMRAAVALPGAQADHFTNLAYVLKRMEQQQESLQTLEQGMRQFPNHAALRWHRSLLLMLLGRYTEALPEYECRWQVSDFPSRARAYACARWQGQADPATTLLVHAEQGFGDTLQFVRYVHLAAARVGTVILEVQSELLRLFQYQQQHESCLPANVELRALLETPSEAAWHCPLLSLPLALGATDFAHPPLQQGYLHAQPGMVVHRDAQGWPKLAVGMVWAGRPTHAQDAERSFGLEAMAPLASVPGIQWFSLQKGVDDLALSRWPAAGKPVNMSSYLNDFLDTAQFIQALDLVITADTSVAHLAAAMGKPVWIPTMKTPDWRWGLAGNTSPWYNSVTLFRQARRGEWEDVFQAMAAALAAQACKR